MPGLERENLPPGGWHAQHPGVLPPCSQPGCSPGHAALLSPSLPPSRSPAASWQPQRLIPHLPARWARAHWWAWGTRSPLPGTHSTERIAPSASQYCRGRPCGSLSPGHMAHGCVGSLGRRQAAARASPTPRDGWHICARRGGCGVGWGTQAPWGTVAAGWAAPGVGVSGASPTTARCQVGAPETALGAPGLLGVLRGHPRRGCSGCRLGVGASPCRGPRCCWLCWRLSSERANSVHGRGAGEAGLLPCWACASAAGRQPAIEPRRGRDQAAARQRPGDGDTHGPPPPRPQSAAWERGAERGLRVSEVGPEQWPCWEGGGGGGLGGPLKLPHKGLGWAEGKGLWLHARQLWSSWYPVAPRWHCHPSPSRGWTRISVLAPVAVPPPALPSWVTGAWCKAGSDAVPGAPRCTPGLHHEVPAGHGTG